MIGIYLSMISDEDNQKKFEEIYVSYKDLMYNVAYCILKDPYLAEDAVHQAFLQIIKSLNSIDDINPSKIKNYLVSVVENSAKAIYNKRKKEINNYSYEINLINIPDGYNIENIVDDQINVRYILKQFDALSETLKIVAYMKFVQDLEDKEIARVLHIKNSTVRKRVQRVREILRERGVYSGGEG